MVEFKIIPVTPVQWYDWYDFKLFLTNHTKMCVLGKIQKWIVMVLNSSIQVEVCVCYHTSNTHTNYRYDDVRKVILLNKVKHTTVQQKQKVGISNERERIKIIIWNKAVEGKAAGGAAVG